MKRLWKIIKKEKVMTISLILAVVSAWIVHPDAEYRNYIDFRVLALLFSLMAVVRGFQSAGLFELMVMQLGKYVKNLKMMVLMLVMLCFFASMLITNDVALITFVPFAILALKRAGEEKHMIRTVVLQTMAANLGSMFTPIGNPQNLYLFSVSRMSATDFFKTMFPITLLSLGLLIMAVIVGIPANPVHWKQEERKETAKKSEWIVYSMLFFVNLLVVFRVIHWSLAFLMTVILILIVQRAEIFRKVDYALLITFAGFFVFIGNIGRIPRISGMLEEMLKGREIVISALFSQFMSNVPAAILLSGFTTDFKGLLLGTNIGGLGTLIASMASLISYKLYAAEEGTSRGKYFLQFTVWNVAGLLILLAVAKLFYRF